MAQEQVSIRLTVPQLVSMAGIIAGLLGAWYDLRSQVHDLGSNLKIVASASAEDHQVLLGVVHDVAEIKASAPHRGRNRGASK